MVSLCQRGRRRRSHVPARRRPVAPAVALAEPAEVTGALSPTAFRLRDIFSEIDRRMERREFLAAAAVAGAGLALADSGRAQTPDPRRRQQRSIWVDAQGGPSGIHEGPGG